MDFNADLISDMARQRVVLFLGAGVSASAIPADGKRIQGWGSFLEAAADRAGEPTKSQALKLIKDKDYLLACEVLQSCFSDDWEDILASEFGKAASPSDLHRAILDLDQRLFLTTNFDKLLEAAWVDKPIDGVRYPRVFSRIDDKIFRALKDHDGRYLIKIHGSIDSPQDIVFSRSQYIRSAFGNAQYAGFLESLLLNYTFLFIGFSMDDPAITSLMELYALRYPNARPHYMMSGDGQPANILEMNKRLRKLVVMQYDPSNHHAALPGILREMSAQSASKRREIVASMMSKA